MKGEAQVVDTHKGNLEMVKDPEMLAGTNGGVVTNFGVLSLVEPDSARGPTALDNRIQYLEDAINFRNSDVMRVLDSDSAEASKFLDAVSEIQLLARNLGASQSFKEGRSINVLFVRVHDILQIAMRTLEDDLVDLLKHNSQPITPNITSFRSENGLSDDFSVNSINEEILQERMQTNESGDSEEYWRDLINPVVLPDIRCIARLMFVSGYDMECCQSYIIARKAALDQYLSHVFPEKMSIEEVLNLEWKSLDRKIGRWIKVMKNFVRVYLSSEKRLCKLIFGDVPKEASNECFFESVKHSIVQLLSFAEAIALLPPSEDKLFRILDVYETLIDLHPEMEALDLEDSGLCILTECREILSRLNDHVRAIFPMFRDKIRDESSDQPSNGGYHPVTRYVMNYLQHMVSYQKTISLIFGGSNCEDTLTSPRSVDETNSGVPFSLPEYLVSVVLVLESNLEVKSWLYQNPALKELFMMNNISYMVKKVRENSDLTKLFGDAWIKDNIGKYKKHASLYRHTWSSILGHLTVDGVPTKKAKKMIQEKLKDFNNAFEELYRVQTQWLIPDDCLRADLQISICNNVIPAYRTFLGRINAILDSSKFVKHSPEELLEYLQNLFEGLPRLLPSHR